MHFFTSDLHFGDDEIIEREARPFKDIKEFEDVFVSNVNKVASREDTLYVIGDWINYNKSHHPCTQDAFEMCRRLYPAVVLVLGNGERRLMADRYHDDLNEMKRSLQSFGVSDVVDSAYIEFGGERFFLTHHPVDHASDCTTLFGHTHRGTGLWKPFGLNVGVDLNHFRPFSEADILGLLKTKREWWDVDPDALCMS